MLPMRRGRGLAIGRKRKGYAYTLRRVNDELRNSAWADPIGRQYLGPGLMTIERVAYPALSRFMGSTR